MVEQMTKACGIKYVEVILIDTSRETGKVVRGILTGYPSKSINCAQFINIQMAAGVIRTCSCSFHHIRTIKVAFTDGSVGKSFFKMVDDDQTRAADEIKDILLELRADDMATAYGIINTLKYKDIPKEFQKNEAPPIYSGHTNNTHSHTCYVHTQTPVKEITFLKRKTKKPSLERIEQLKIKTMLVSSNTYKGKELPALVDNDEEETANEMAAKARETADIREYYGECYF